MSPAATLFNDAYAPMIWAALLPMWGADVEYWVGGDPNQSITITVIWKEGAEDEDVSPGRYSHMLIQNADLPGRPKMSDVIYRDSQVYDVVRVNLMTINYSSVVLQSRSETL